MPNDALDASVRRCRRLWEERAAGDRAPDESDGYAGPVYASRYGDVTARLEPDGEALLLDAGCGRGSLLDHLKEHFGDAVGLDLAHNNLHRLRKEQGPVKATQASAHRLPFASASFDRVLLYGVLHYFPSWEDAGRVVSELMRVCGDGGLALLGDNEPLVNTAFDPPIKKGPTNPSRSRPGDVQLCFSQAFFQDLADEHGWQVTFGETWGQPGHFDVVLRWS